MVLYKPTWVNTLPEISWPQENDPADPDPPPPVLFILPNEAQVKVLDPPTGVESKGNWEKIRAQLGKVCYRDNQLPEVNIGVPQTWLVTSR